jgi:serine protease AprX
MRYTKGNNRKKSKIDYRLLKKVDKQVISKKKVTAIVYSANEDDEKCKSFLQRMGITIKYELPIIHAYAIEVPENKVNQMVESESIKYIEDDVELNSMMDIARKEVGVDRINKLGITGKKVGIAIIDTGVFPHNDLVKPTNRIVAFKDFINGRQQPYDDNGHGTFVAGIAAGNGDGSGGKYAGIAPHANIIAIKVMDKKGNGKTTDIIAGMQWVVDNAKKYNIKIMSLSLGTKPDNYLNGDTLAKAAESVWERGILVVAAAGNSGPQSASISTPGISNKIITVGAVDDKRTPSIRDDRVAEFSSRGPGWKKSIKPDIVAPGVKIKSINTNSDYLGMGKIEQPEKKYTVMTGTSMATPIISGIGALMLEVKPDMSPLEIKTRMLQAAVPINRNAYAGGRGIVQSKGLF